MKKLTRYNVKIAFNGEMVHLKNEVNEHGQWVNTGSVEELETENDKLRADKELQRQVNTATLSLLREIVDGSKSGVWGYYHQEAWLEKVERLVKAYDESTPEDRTLMSMLDKANKELEQVTSHAKELGKENDRLSNKVNELLTDLGKAYRDLKEAHAAVEKWKEEYRVTEEARASFEKTAVANQRENIELKMNRAQELHGEQVKSGEYLIKQMRGFKVDCLIAEGRSTVMTPDELDAYDPVASLREKVEKIKELERQKSDDDDAYEILRDEFRQLKADYYKLAPIRKAIDGIPGPFLLAWTVCQLQNVETFAKAVLKYRRAKESQ